MTYLETALATFVNSVLK